MKLTPMLRNGIEDLLTLYNDVQAEHPRMRSSDDWIVLEHRIKVVRQALQADADTPDEAEALRTELTENEGVIKCLRRHRDEAETKLETLTEWNDTLCKAVWEVIETMESGDLWKSTMTTHLALAHKLRHAVGAPEPEKENHGDQEQAGHDKR